jgi:hypothetical protein
VGNCPSIKKIARQTAQVGRRDVRDLSTEESRAESVSCKEVANYLARENIKFLISDFACWIVAEIAHATVAKDAKEYRGGSRVRVDFGC